MKRILTQNFFNRPTLTVAKELLGKFLVRRIGQKEIAGVITEVEAYIGPEDRASHVWRGYAKARHDQMMFEAAGRWFVYLTYGMHWMLNIVTERKGYPAAVLIRATDNVYGPGRLTRFFRVDNALNKKPATKRTGLWIEARGLKITPGRIRQGKRIGVEYAGAWKNKPWRFYIQN